MRFLKIIKKIKLLKHGKLDMEDYSHLEHKEGNYGEQAPNPVYKIDQEIVFYTNDSDIGFRCGLVVDIQTNTNNNRVYYLMVLESDHHTNIYTRNEWELVPYNSPKFINTDELVSSYEI